MNSEVKKWKGHQDCFNLALDVNWGSFTNMVLMFVPSNWYFVCFVLWLQVLTFMEVEELWAFGLFVLLVHSQAYHLCCFLFMANLEALPRIGSMYFMMAGNWRGLDYKEQMFDQARQFGGFEKNYLSFSNFVFFGGEFMTIWVYAINFMLCVVGEECSIAIDSFFTIVM